MPLLCHRIFPHPLRNFPFCFFLKSYISSSPSLHAYYNVFVTGFTLSIFFSFIFLFDYFSHCRYLFSASLVSVIISLLTSLFWSFSFSLQFWFLSAKLVSLLWWFLPTYIMPPASAVCLSRHSSVSSLVFSICSFSWITIRYLHLGTLYSLDHSLHGELL